MRDEVPIAISDVKFMNPADQHQTKGDRFIFNTLKINLSPFLLAPFSTQINPSPFLGFFFSSLICPLETLLLLAIYRDLSLKHRIKIKQAPILKNEFLEVKQ